MASCCGFLTVIKGCMHDIVEKIIETIGCAKPTAEVTGIHISHIDLEKIDLAVDVLAKNPNRVAIPLASINYVVASNERKLVSGSIVDSGTIPAHGSETVKIPVSLVYHDIKSTFDDIKPGSIIPYIIKVELTVNVPILGKQILPLEEKGQIPIPYPPSIDIEKFHFDKFSIEESVATLHLKLENKNDFELGLKDLDYEVWLSDISIGGAALTKSAQIAKNSVCNIEIPITFKPKDFGSALWDMMRGKGTSYTMKGNITVDTPFGEMKMPVSREGGTTHLNNKNEDGNDHDDKE